MSAEAHILLSGHRLLIIVLQEYIGIVCRFCDQKKLCTVPIMWFVIQVVVSILWWFILFVPCRHSGSPKEAGYCSLGRSSILQKLCQSSV